MRDKNDDKASRRLVSQSRSANHPLFSSDNATVILDNTTPFRFSGSLPPSNIICGIFLQALWESHILWQYLLILWYDENGSSQTSSPGCLSVNWSSLSLPVIAVGMLISGVCQQHTLPVSFPRGWLCSSARRSAVIFHHDLIPQTHHWLPVTNIPTSFLFLVLSLSFFFPFIYFFFQFLWETNKGICCGCCFVYKQYMYMYM